MLKSFVADLHVHSLLSPCAAVEMTPHNIILNAAAHGIDIVAITDHNAGDNVAAALNAARGTRVTVLPGMEVETQEEIHIVTLFDTNRQFMQWQDIVASSRSGMKNNEQRFGAQFVVNEQDELVSIKEELLLAPLSMSVEQVVATVNALGGACIAAHIDRPAYSIIANLGFIPEHLELAAVEITARSEPKAFLAKHDSVRKFPVVCHSDAHSIEDFIMGPKTIYIMEYPNLQEVRQAFCRTNGRRWLVNN